MSIPLVVILAAITMAGLIHLGRVEEQERDGNTPEEDQ